MRNHVFMKKCEKHNAIVARVGESCAKCTADAYAALNAESRAAKMEPHEIRREVGLELERAILGNRERNARELVTFIETSCSLCYKKQRKLEGWLKEAQPGVPLTRAEVAYAFGGLVGFGAERYLAEYKHRFGLRAQALALEMMVDAWFAGHRRD